MSKKLRVAIVDQDKCKSDKCKQECMRGCPVNAQGKKCIELENIIIGSGKESKNKKIAKINESLCIGCNICTQGSTKTNSSSRGCPYGAISIINIPQEIKGNIIHRFGDNGFRLYKLPTLENNSILGIIGQNGLGKSLAVKILSNKIKPNFENFKEQKSDKEIIKMFRGNQTQKYLELLYGGKLKVVTKPQHVEYTTTVLKARKENPTIKEFILQNTTIDLENPKLKELLEDLDMTNLLDYKVITLSGGELQRLVIIICLVKEADVYIFDEPSNFLDVKQRLHVAKQIRKLIQNNKYVIVIEHDLAMLDYMADTICIMYGVPSAYGVISMPSGTAEAINNYFDGYIPTENMRFRKDEYNLKSLNEITDLVLTENNSTSYPDATIKYDKFQLDIKGGKFKKFCCLNLIVSLNGAGKTSFINCIKDKLGLTVSMKPQYLDFDKFKNKDGDYPTVDDLLYTMIKSKYTNETFRSEVVRPLNLQSIGDRNVNELSGGERQKVWLTLCLGKDSDVYMIDEPSACLDIEQRVIVTKIIKRYIINHSKVAFIIDHDLMIITSMAQETNSQIINLEPITINSNFRHFVAHPPTSFNSGINKFLEMMDITFRTDPIYNRPRINKHDSQKEIEQKKIGKYYM
jgi:ATP-binding cassette subfamily E protein 1